MNPMIRLENITKRFGKTVALKTMNLEVMPSEFVVLLGPSGCGKTTTLRCIAGLETPTEGNVYIDGEYVNDLPTLDRDVGFVFQHYALFPHLTAFDNIAFPLKAMRRKKKEISESVEEVLELLRIKDCRDLRPRHLSGGDMQRVALARALVTRPKVFLMDEPLSNLDAEFREEMRTIIKQIHLESHATTVYVTHDQVEAMAIADRIVTMNAGEVQQVGSPEQVYLRPTNVFVANFIGSPGMNLVNCHIDQTRQIRFTDAGKDSFGTPVPENLIEKIEPRDVVLGVRPEDVELSFTPVQHGIPMEVGTVENLGPETIVNVSAGSLSLRALTGSDSPAKRGDPVWVRFNTERIRLFDNVTKETIV